MEEELKESGLNQYEIQAVTNLANIKIISRILTITMKKFLKKIDGFRASKIV